MRRIAALGLVIAVCCAGCHPFVAVSATSYSASSGFHLGKVRHVVLFKFKDAATPEQIQAIEDKFRALPKKIPEILGLEWGTDMSTEGLAAGYTHCFVLTFADAKARDTYLPHPEHEAFGKALAPVLDKVLVIDYVARR